MKAWYFSQNNCRLRYGDHRKIEAGTIHTVDCEPLLCQRGLHGSKRITDALNYAPGSYIWRVNITGSIAKGGDKICGKSREYLWGFDAEDLLRRCARKCALDVVDLWDAPEIVLRYLRDGDESIRDAAMDAARYAMDAAWDASGAARYARHAARYAMDAARYARHATRDAIDAARYAIDAARDARHAARDVARAAAREVQNKRLTAMVSAEAKKRGFL